jgi:hypothetical protein
LKNGQIFKHLQLCRWHKFEPQNQSWKSGTETTRRRCLGLLENHGIKIEFVLFNHKLKEGEDQLRVKFNDVIQLSTAKLLELRWVIAMSGRGNT